mmetsp:Transcript_47672/g.134578  ORF Transcript_47672/g.134578 Transcript_47672/m.134578 type:complete len:414 (-) Transcript_47672:41-1282(-)
MAPIQGVVLPAVRGAEQAHLAPQAVGGEPAVHERHHEYLLRQVLHHQLHKNNAPQQLAPVHVEIEAVEHHGGQQDRDTQRDNHTALGSAQDAVVGPAVPCVEVLPGLDETAAPLPVDVLEVLGPGVHDVEVRLRGGQRGLETEGPGPGSVPGGRRVVHEHRVPLPAAARPGRLACPGVVPQVLRPPVEEHVEVPADLLGDGLRRFLQARGPVHALHPQIPVLVLVRGQRLDAHQECRRHRSGVEPKLLGPRPRDVQRATKAHVPGRVQAHIMIPVPRAAVRRQRGLVLRDGARDLVEQPRLEEDPEQLEEEPGQEDGRLQPPCFEVVEAAPRYEFGGVRVIRSLQPDRRLLQPPLRRRARVRAPCPVAPRRRRREGLRAALLRLLAGEADEGGHIAPAAPGLCRGTGHPRWLA